MNRLNFYISDIHFGHKNAIEFDERPFADVREMDETIIKHWNARVAKDDDVYVLGDFCYRSEYTPDWYLKQLKGHKHLLIGNHDNKLITNERAMSYFESVDKMMHVSDNGKQICLCHFPIAEWYGSHRGCWHIYGHIHGNMDETYYIMREKERALNAAACLNNYMPVTMDELILNNEIHRQKGADSAKSFWMKKWD